MFSAGQERTRYFHSNTSSYVVLKELQDNTWKDVKEEVIKYGCGIEWEGGVLSALDYPTLKKMLKEVDEHWDKIKLDVKHVWPGGPSFEDW